jgi:hypothetical protein
MLHRGSGAAEYWRRQVENPAGRAVTAIDRIIACRLPKKTFRNKKLCDFNM